LALSAQKAGNGNPSLLELGIGFNGIWPVRRNMPIAMNCTTEGRSRSNKQRKIDPTFQKGFSVFPKRMKFVNGRVAGFFGALLTREQTFGP